MGEPPTRSPKLCAFVMSPQGSASRISGSGFALLITSSMWKPVSAGAHDNPALRIIEGRIGETLELFGDCRLREIASIAECFAPSLAPKPQRPRSRAGASTACHVQQPKTSAVASSTSVSSTTSRLSAAFSGPVQSHCMAWQQCRALACSDTFQQSAPPIYEQRRLGSTTATPHRSAGCAGRLRSGSRWTPRTKCGTQDCPRTRLRARPPPLPLRAAPSRNLHR